MAMIGRVSATRGTLIRFRDTLRFIKKGKEILKMKRDQLAGELNKLLDKLALRSEVEKQLIELYQQAKELYATLGYSEVANIASSVPLMRVETRPLSIMGVVIPVFKLGGKPEVKTLQHIGVYELWLKLNDVFEKILKVAEIEAKIERIAEELMMTNRKVNALEKAVIPQYGELITYIENRLFEEDLEEFIRIRHIRNVIEERRRS